MKELNDLWIYPVIVICSVLVLWLLISFIYSCYMRLYANSILKKYQLHKEIYPKGIPVMIQRLFIDDICLYDKRINVSGIIWIIPRLRLDNLLEL